MQNIIATFTTPDDLHAAVDRLQRDAGLPKERMHLKESRDAEFIAQGGPSQSRPGEPGYREKGVLESFGGFWASLLESHTDESGIYAENLRQGRSLLMVEAASDDEARRICRLLRDCGARELEEHAGSWRAQGWESPS